MVDAPEPGDDPGLSRVRAGVLGAAPAPHLSVIEGGRGGETPPDDPPSDEPGGPEGGVPQPAEPTPESTCPLVCLGHRKGVFHFLDAVGQERTLSASALGKRGDLTSLFLGDERWLLRWFPNIVKRTKKDTAGNETVEEEVRGFSVAAAASRLQQMSARAGLYGPHVVLRAAGVWAGEDGAPIVHCGDLVLKGRAWLASGFRDGNQVWMTEHAIPRPGAAWEGWQMLPGEPGFASGAMAGRGIQNTMRELWDFRLAGSEIICMGLMAVGFYGAAARWRPNGYLIGGTGSGKSMMLNLMQSCVPYRAYHTDTSKAGIEGSLDGSPKPVYLDEAGDRQGDGPRILLDVVLSASGGDGTKGVRGSMDGGARTFSVAGQFIMAATAHPEFEQAHRDRFTVVKFNKPAAGVDNRGAMEAAIKAAAAAAPLLWGRAIEGWPRFVASLAVFRDALGRAGCLAREMDQMGAILSAWWVMTEDGVPTAEQAVDGVGAVGEFVRGAEASADDDTPRRVVRHLATSLVQLHRSTDTEVLGALVERAFDGPETGERKAAFEILERNGIRVVRAEDKTTTNGKRIPRGSDAAGLWLAKSSRPLRTIFAGSVYQGERWATEIARLPSAVESRKSVRVATVAGPAIWIDRADWSPPDDDEGGLPEEAAPVGGAGPPEWAPDG